MKILITGINSYVGNALAEYLRKYSAKNAGNDGHAGSVGTGNTEGGERAYKVDFLSLRGDAWKSKSFAEYDTIFHMVGKAHADIEHVSEETKKEYYEVNRDLAVSVAKKAGQDGVKQFVYMSSVIVYGDSAKVGKQKHITAHTSPAPANFYGDSKWQAEQELSKLSREDFAVAFVRSPMVYGKESKGNYRTLKKIALKLPFFPKIRNQRSMIYIENLAEFLRLLAESGRGGVFFPQNEEFVSTADMVKAIADAHGRRIRLCGILNPFVYVASWLPGRQGKFVNKAFGSLTVDKKLSNCEITGYQRYSFEESIKRSI